MLDLSPSELPAELSDQYDCLSCLKSSPTGETFLCVQKSSGLQVIVKTAPSSDSEPLRNEYDLLTSLHASCRPEALRFPQAIDLLELKAGHEPLTVLIRNYVAGRTLESRVESQEKQPGLPETLAVRCVCDILEQVAFLHRQSPPLIHRDIKPQNVIMNEDGACCLIDFGIARGYQPKVDQDTTVAGTRLTAPPEQFGYWQTDQRSDIYSVGVLLRYCLTGEYGREADDSLSPALRRIVLKATSFDPARRYGSAESMLRALKRLPYGRVPVPRFRWLLLSACLVLVLLAGFFVLFLHAHSERSRPYVFREPLLEAAVREALHRPEGELTLRDLKEVEEIHIFGRQIYEREDQIWFLGAFPFLWDAGLRASEDYLVNGGISSLKDLQALPSLKALCLYNQEISDIEALRNTEIATIGLGYNPLVDLSPLEGNRAIRSLNLSCLAIDSADLIATLPNLTDLTIAGTDIASLEPLRDMPIESFNFFGITFTDVWPMTTWKHLQTVLIGNLDEDIVHALNETSVTHLTVTHAMQTPLSALSELSELEYLFFAADEPQTISDSPLPYPHMTEVDIKYVHGLSLKCYSEMEKLETLNLYASTYDSVEGLENLKSLKTIFCTSEQAAMLGEAYPDHGFTIHVID